MPEAGPPLAEIKLPESFRGVKSVLAFPARLIPGQAGMWINQPFNKYTSYAVYHNKPAIPA